MTQRQKSSESDADILFFFTSNEAGTAKTIGFISQDNEAISDYDLFDFLHSLSCSKLREMRDAMKDSKGKKKQ